MSAAVTATARLRRTVRVTSDAAPLAQCRDEIGAMLRMAGWNQADVFRILVCADEVMANAFTHGSAPGDAIAVRATITSARTVLSVTDSRGLSIPLCEPVTHPAETDEHGRGLILMYALADNVRIRQHATGTLVALTFVHEDHRSTKGDAR